MSSVSTSSIVNIDVGLNNNITFALPGLPYHYKPDGSHNHPLHPKRGAVNTPRIRAHPPYNTYLDGLFDDHDDQLWHHPRLDLPSPRKILVELFQKVKPRKNERANQMLVNFGHFVTRDITRTWMFDNSSPMPIACDMVETRGPFCPKGQKFMEFYRAARKTNDGDDDNVGDHDGVSNTGEPINSATSWLDMDHVYGNAPISSPDYLKYRTGAGGRMKLDNSTGLPPLDDETGLYSVYDDAMRKLPTDLALMSTFLQYHNRRADHYSKLHPKMDDETIYWKARMDVLAVYQSTFEGKYVPAILGDPLEEYGGYNSSVDASIDVFFSTCSFRYGHSAMSGVVRLLDKDFGPLPLDPMLMRDVFDRTEEILRLIGSSGARDAISAVIRGLAHDPGRAPDASFADDTSLFMEANAVMNIQRGRDNGLATYNSAREWFGLDPVENYLDLADGDEDLAKILEGLYGKGNVDSVDPYVGAMLERPGTKHDELGPLNEAVVRNQLTRLRDGDRLWYRERLSEEEIQQLPTLSDLIRDAWGEGEEMQYFPEDVFAIVPTGGGPGGSGGSPMGTGGKVELFDGDLVVEWMREKRFIDFTMRTPELIEGGYIGLGWESRAMKGAEIWFCQSNEIPMPFGDSCFGDDDETPREKLPKDSGPFSCCVASGQRHVRPKCEGQNYLEVVDSCASTKGSYVRVHARLCKSSGEEKNCFSTDSDDVDFIAAYNPNDSYAAHGFSRRTGGVTNLALGTVASCSDDSAQAGLFALHGATLLVAWLILAPVAIYVARYCKDKPWRLKLHISLVGVIGGLMFTLVGAAMVSVEGTSFGTVDASSATFSVHKKFGLIIIFFVAFMAVTGELRRRRTITQKTNSVALERAVILSHRCGGLLLVGLAWYNCYIGLVQISPYESDSVELTFMSSKVLSVYDLEFFGFVRKYLFIPWVCIIVLTFIIKEICVRSAEGNCTRDIEASMKGAQRILTIKNEKDLPTMDIETFLFLTKHGNALSIIDGYVIDISTFMDVHPGGTNVLRFAVGSDITSYFVGDLDVNGLRHNHSPTALKALRPLVKSKLESGSIDSGGSGRNRRISLQSLQSSGRKLSEEGGTSQRGAVCLNRQAMAIGTSQSMIVSPQLSGRVFRNAKVVKHTIVSAKADPDQKYTIKFCISLKREEGIDAIVGTPLPSTTFIFRAVDSQGNAFERAYSATLCYLSEPKEEEISRKNSVLPLHWSKTRKRADTIEYQFFITIVPGGKMSTILAKKTAGKHIMVKGPLASKTFLEKLRQRAWADVCLITQGTGISTSLQLIDYYLKMPHSPKMTLVWFVRDRHRDWEDALGLASRESVSENFRYLIVSDKEDTQSRPSLNSINHDDKTFNGAEIGYEAMEAFLQLYHSQDLHRKTIDSLLFWVLSWSKKRISEPEDMSEVGEQDLPRISESLRSVLPDKFSGSEAVSFLQKEYTSTRESALMLGRELASKSKLFRHVSDAKKSFVDDADDFYTFNKIRREDGSRDLDRTLGLLVALCGHRSFETDVTDALKTAEVRRDQIVRFPEGSMPLSGLLEFIRNESEPSRTSKTYVASNKSEGRRGEGTVPKAPFFGASQVTDDSKKTNSSSIAYRCVI